MSATDAALALLTETHTLVVVDVETCPAADGGPPRIVSIATAPIVRGRPPRHYRATLIDPGEPITNSSIHHITDAMVASVKVRPFAERIASLNLLLNAPRTVLVAHNATYDINALRGEYDRANQALPDIPVLDTMRLASLLGATQGRSR